MTSPGRVSTAMMAVAALLILLTGCRSLSSTMLYRDLANMEWETEKSDGVPITLRVPTHVKIIVEDTHYLQKPDTVWKFIELIPGQPLVTSDCRHEMIVTEKIFTVDPKRPAAGSLDYTLDLDEDQQYISKLESDITDETIEQVSRAFERVFGAISSARTGAGGLALESTIAVADNPLRELTSVRCVAVFEIDDPMFEDNIAAFLSEQFCPGTCPAPVYRGLGDMGVQTGICRVPEMAPAVGLSRSSTGSGDPVHSDADTSAISLPLPPVPSPSGRMATQSSGGRP